MKRKTRKCGQEIRNTGKEKSYTELKDEQVSECDCMMCEYQ
jgi:hypothetical protein